MSEGRGESDGERAEVKRRPSGAPEIPEVLRQRPRESREKGPTTMSALARGLALGWDLVGSVAAGLVIGVLVDTWLGSSPVGVLVGLGLGMTVSTTRIIKQASGDGSGRGSGRGSGGESGGGRGRRS